LMGALFAGLGVLFTEDPPYLGVFGADDDAWKFVFEATKVILVKKIRNNYWKYLRLGLGTGRGWDTSTGDGCTWNPQLEQNLLISCRGLPQLEQNFGMKINVVGTYDLLKMPF
jgi:hypothetical protein